jgi:xanthine dehydrogenase YagR molybdenum-binding subunit
MSILQDAMKVAIGLVPDRWLPGGTPDPLRLKHGLIGKPVSRIDGPLKVTGKARFAAEIPLDGLVYARSSTARLLAAGLSRSRPPVQNRPTVSCS